MRALTAPLLAGALLLAGCGGATNEEPKAQASTAAPTTAAPTSARTTVADPMQVAVNICTDGMAGPDQVIYDAVHAARAGTRAPAEIADSFRYAQDALEGLAIGAETAGLPNLTQALRNYADTLGRARVTGSAGLPDITDAREAINIACYSPAAPVST